jgi:hypothetical protein
MGTGLIVGILVVLVAVVVAFFLFSGFGRSATGNAGQTNVNVPAQNAPAGGPNINVPRQIDINVNQPSAPAPSNP